MTFYVTNQNTVIGVMLLVGVFAGILYDLFTVKRILLKTPAAMLFFEDILFCLIVCTVFVFSIFITNYGYVRWFECAAFLSGLGIYRFFISQIFVKMLVTVFRFFIRFVKIIAVFLISPVLAIGKILVRKLLKIFAFIREKTRENSVKTYSKRRKKREIRQSLHGFDA